MHIRQVLALLLSGVTLCMVTLPHQAEAKSRAEGSDGYFISERVNSTPSSLFHFVVIVKDDGEGKGGGYQRASATLRFVDARAGNGNIWDCDVTIGMPLRTEKVGPISPGYAAGVTAVVVDAATDRLMETQPSWTRGTYCSKYKNELQTVFRERFSTFGARVEACQ